MNWTNYALLILLLGGLLFVGSAPAAADWNHETVEGAAIPVPDSLQHSLEEQINDLKDQHEHPDPTVMLLHTEDTTYIIATEHPEIVGSATATGYTTSEDGMGYMVVEDMEIDAEPTFVERETLRENQDEYVGEYVAIESVATQSVYAYDGGDGRFHQPNLYGRLTDGGRSQIAESAQFLVVNKSDNGPSLNDDAIMNRLVAGFSLVGVRNDFKTDGVDARVEGVVLPRGPTEIAGDSDWPVLYSTSFETIGEAVPSAQLVETPEKYEGEVVQTELDMFGSTISAKRAVVAASGCGGVELVGVAPYCIPGVTDAQIHTGAAVHPDVDEQMLAYGGISNHLQTSLTSPVSGRYTVTARVVNGSEIHPGVEGYALFIYELEREGRTRATGEIRDDAEEAGDKMVNAIQDQLSVRWSERDTYAEENHESPIPNYEPELVIIDAEYQQQTVQPGSEVNVDVKVRNGGYEGEVVVAAMYGEGLVRASESIYLGSGESDSITLSWVADDHTGSLRYNVNGTDIGLLQRDQPTPTSSPNATIQSETEGDGPLNPLLAIFTLLFSPILYRVASTGL